MDEDTKWILAFILALAAVFGGIGTIATADNENTWERTEDPACYLHVHKDHHVWRLADSEVTRARYCRA